MIKSVTDLLIRGIVAFYGFITFFLILLIHPPVFAQTSYLMSLENATLTNNNIFEFDVYIKSTGNNFSLTSYQCAFTFQVGNSNNGTLTFAYTPNSTELSNAPSVGIGINQYDGVKKLTFASMVGNDNINSAAKKVGRFILQNSAAFTSQTFEISWSFSGTVNTILTGSSHSVITNSSNHTDLFFEIESPPRLLSASAVNSNVIELTFSKEIDPATANNSSNYSINNGISVSNAVLSNGNVVTLTTSEHISGQTYTVAANNIKDLNGNLIDPAANSQQYTYNYNGLLYLNVKVFLQGPYSNGSMSTSLKDLSFIPLNQPYNVSPWSYTGSESVSNIPADVVDWILLELRSETSSSTRIMERAAFVKNDGSVVDLDGVSNVKLMNGTQGGYYVVVIHRNHLPIMSSDKVIISENPPLYDFTIHSGKAYGNNAQSDFGDGRFGMYSGDGNSNRTVNNADANSVWKKDNGKLGYYMGDFDLNGGVTIADKNEKWKPNNGKSSQVP
jgi:hypothetical protein